MSFRPARFHLVTIRWPWYLLYSGDSMQSNHQCGELPSFPSTMEQKARSPVTKTHGLTELHFVFSLGGGRGQSWDRIINCVLPSCVQPRKHPSQIFFSLPPIGAMNMFPIIPPLSLLNWTCASLKILLMFIPDVIFLLIFMLALNSPFPWSLPIKRPIDTIDQFLFDYSHIIRYSPKVRINPACLYQKFMCSFSIPFSFSYSYVTYYDSICPVPKFCTTPFG